MDSTRKIIAKAFNAGANEYKVSDDFIVQNPSLMEIDVELDYMQYVPAYMDWCIRNKDNYDQHVIDDTVSALAEYGRSKTKENVHLIFKFLCNDEQRTAVLAFHTWCLSNLLFLNREQIKRSMKHWS